MNHQVLLERLLRLGLLCPTPRRPPFLKKLKLTCSLADLKQIIIER